MFDAEGAKIVVVSFGVEAGAKKWIEETSCQYTLLLDPDRKIYGSIGLIRSVSKTWGTKPFLYYAEQVAAGRELPAAYKNIEDDPNQMGGNLILDSEGRAVFIHRSQSSPDRPTVEKILSVIKKAKKSAVNDLNKEGPSLSTQPQTQEIESSGTDDEHVTAKNGSLSQEQNASNSSFQS